jgi:hypothetical protein
MVHFFINNTFFNFGNAHFDFLINNAISPKPTNTNCPGGSQLALGGTKGALQLALARMISPFRLQQG